MTQPIDILIKSVAARQRSLIGTEVLAPRVSGEDKLAIRVNGLVYSYNMYLGELPGAGRDFLNPLRWWKIVTTDHAMFERNVESDDISRYLKRLPQIPVVYVGGEAELCFIANANGAYGLKSNFPISAHFMYPPNHSRLRGLVRFRTLDARFDGTRLWVAGVVRDRVDTTKFEEYMTQATGVFSSLYGPSRCRVKHAQPGHYDALKFVLDRVAESRKKAAEEQRELRELTVRQKIDEALSFSGGILKSYEDRGQERIRVTYHVGGRRYVTTVREDMSVVAAGFCTAGHDTDHDLTTLVDLIRYGQSVNHYAVE